MAVLFTITTDRLHLTWSGPPAPDDPTAPPGALHVQPLRAEVRPRVELREGLTAESLRLAEQTPYRVFARSRNGEAVVLRHADPLATRGLAADQSGSVFGMVDFGGQVGRSRFVVAVGGIEEVTFEVEVFPAKLAFADVEAMRAEVDEALAGIAFEYLRSTAMQAEHTDSPPSRATWLVMLRRVLPELESALERIAAQPHYGLQREVTLVRIDRVQRPDATLRRAVLQGRGRGTFTSLSSGLTVRTMLPERRAVATLDTPEHRWLYGRIAGARAALAAVQQDESRLPRSARRNQVLRDLTDAERRLARLLHTAPLAAAEVEVSAVIPTQRLLTAPGYAEAYQACQALSLSLTLADGPVPHATRDLHLLYEMWCYLVVLRRVANVLRMPLSPEWFFRAEHRGVRLMLRRGRRHGVTFDLGARNVHVAYNPRFAARHGLLSQRPDILLTVEEGGAEQHYVLDAKYRRDDTAGYVRRFGAPGPPEDALGDLHRYRDAIRDGAGRRTVTQAVALFPYRADEAFGESRLWTAIRHVGVGAIPLLPGATDYLGRWLADVLG